MEETPKKPDSQPEYEEAHLTPGLDIGFEEGKPRRRVPLEKVEKTPRSSGNQGQSEHPSHETSEGDQIDDETISDSAEMGLVDPQGEEQAAATEGASREKRKGRKEKKVFIEQEEAPWAEIGSKDEERLLKGYRKQFELGGEAKKTIEKVLQEQSDEQRISFALEWFADNQETLQQEGVATDVALERKVAIALERGAFRELQKGAYKEKFGIAIENLDALRSSLKSDVVPIADQCLILNVLEKKSAGIQDRIETLQGASDSAGKIELEVRKKEFRDLLKIRLELAGKISGRNFEEEAKGEVFSLGPKTTFVEQGMDEEKRVQKIKKVSEIFQREWDVAPAEQKTAAGDVIGFSTFRTRELSQKIRAMNGVGLDEDSALALFAAGYKPEAMKVKGWLRKKIQLREDQIFSAKAFVRFAEEEKKKFLQNIETNSKQVLEAQWDLDYQEQIQSKIGEKITVLIESPEDVIVEAYSRMKERLIAEYEREGLKKEKKTREQLQKIDEEFGEKGVNPVSFIEKSIKLRERLTGKTTKDAKAIYTLLDDEGIIPEHLTSKQQRGLQGLVTQAIDHRGKEYLKTFSRRKTFVNFLFDVISSLLEEIEEAH